MTSPNLVVKRYLHIVVDLESGESKTNSLFSNYPVLYKDAEIIWLASDNARELEQRAKDIISVGEPLQQIPRLDYLPKFFEPMLADASLSPLRFSHLVRTYVHFYKIATRDVHKRLETLQSGVDKLSAAHKVVAELQKEAGEKEVALGEKRELAKNALEMISNTMKSATEKKNDLMEMKSKAQENSKLLTERKAAVELELKEVEPLLKEAIAAVGQIKTEALSEIRSLRAPPDIIRDILEGVLRLMGTKDTSWNSMKSFLSKRGVKEDIRSLNPSKISTESCVAVEKLLNSKADSFEVKNAKRASAAAAPLAAWVIANVKYCKVIQSVRPLEEEQEKLERDLKISENNMKLLKSGLDDVDARVKELSNQLNVYTQEAAVLELKLENVQKSLKKSEVLISKLSTEYKNWKTQLEEIHKKVNSVDLEAFYIAFVISQLSHLVYEKRQ